MLLCRAMEFRAAAGDAFTYAYTSDTVFKTQGKDRFETVQSCRVMKMPGSVMAKSSQWVLGVGFLSGVTCTQDRDQEILDECVDGDRARTHLGVRAKGTQMQGSLRPITQSYPKIRRVPHSLHPLPE